MKNPDLISGRMRSLLLWPLFLLPVVLLLSLLGLVWKDFSHVAVLAFFCIYLLFLLWWIFFWKGKLEKELVDFALCFNQEQKQQIEGISVPYALITEEGSFVWMNQAFRRITMEKRYQKQLFTLFPSLEEALPEDQERKSQHVQWEERFFRVEMQKMGESPHLISVFLLDETERLAALNEIENQKIAVGQIYVDNYEEVMKSTEPVRQSLLAALIERKLNKYFHPYGAIIRKLDKDKYLLLFKKKDLCKVQEKRFSLLEEIKSLSIGNETAVTLSIGIGVDGETLEQNRDLSGKALDLCLGRGGDQAIVRTPKGSNFYGGKTQRQEKNTRVKARIKAQALRELLMTKDQVLIMGHKLSDIDSVGAAIGIFRAARTLDKKAHIVLQNVTSSVRPLMERFQESGDYPDDLFISREKAINLLDETTTVIVVDVNKPSYTECPELLSRSGSVVVLDHHRQGEETIEQATLSYIEPYASSACEMVAEILQYFSDNLKLKPLEAEAIYAGIVVDTNNFMSKTGVRTFEAAAYLRRCGVDMTRVRRLFKGQLEDLRAKAETMRSVEIIENAIAFGVCPGDGVESPMIVGAQAANELLDIAGIKASIVFTKYQDQVYISARSMDEINVQLIMERLGGGGHLGTAGTQLKGCTVEEAKTLVKETIRHMLEEGVI